MANAYILNMIPNSYGQALSIFVEMLVSAGWSYKASGDGLSGYSATGKIFSGVGAGAQGWNNNRAWARIAAPDGRRELCVQHNAANGVRFKYSATAKFIGGAPNATTVPSATDERVVWGAGTDATPTLTTFYPTQITTSGVKFHGMASDTDPFGFWWTAALTPAGAMQCGMALDPVESVPEDPDPVVLHIGQTGAFTVGALGSAAVAQGAGSYPAPGTAQQGTWGHMDVPMAQFLYVMPAQFATGLLVAGASPGTNTHVTVCGSSGFGMNPFNSKHEALGLLWMRPTAAGSAPGIKGWSKSMRWSTIFRAHAVDTLDNKKWISVAGNVWMPWDGVTSPTN